ncbi:MAG: DUF3168 domain-containing protein [Christensenella sp.]
MIKRIPNNALQKALIALFKAKLSVPAYDFVTSTAKMPYVSLGAFTCRDISTKTEDISHITLQINIFSSYRGKYEINAIAEQIISILTSEQINLDEDFYTTMQAINMYEAFPEDENSYSGVVSFECEIQNIRSEE